MGASSSLRGAPGQEAGNKRLGWLATAVFLGLNGVTVSHIPSDDVYDFVIDVTVGSHEIGEIAEKLRRLANP